MKHVWTIETAIAAVLITAGCGTGNNGDGNREPVPVKVITLKEQSGTGARNYVGNVIPDKTAILSCSYPGTLVNLAVSQGDQVRKGDVIAEIRSQSVISSREMAYATLKQAEDGYKRVSQVHSSGSVADVKMVEIETQLSKARAAAQAADNAMENCTVRAPFDGVIGDIFTEQGVELGAVDPIARILDVSRVEISFSVPEHEIGQISIGDSASVEIPALGGARVTATLKSKGITASPLSHSYTCTLNLPDKHAGLMPGMVCKVTWLEDTGKGIVIPASVVRTDATGRYVWTVTGDTVHKRYITAGSFSGKGITVDEGLAPGDKVITEGIQKVSSGMNVKVLE